MYNAGCKAGVAILQSKFTHVPSEHDESEDELYPHPPHDVPPPHVARVRREDEAERQEDEDAAGRGQPLGGVDRVDDDEGGDGGEDGQVAQAACQGGGEDAVNGRREGLDQQLVQALAEEADDDL